MEAVEHLRIPLEEIRSATNNFNKRNRIGLGIYWQELYNGLRTHSRGNLVHVKSVIPGLRHKFLEEIMMLSHYKHENLVSLVGFCMEDGKRVFVYENVSNKSLRMYLSSTDLSWNQRLRICIGAARGIKYLHSQSIGLHFRIDSSYILLDQNWNAKIAHFGLSRPVLANEQPIFHINNEPISMDTADTVYYFGSVLGEVIRGEFIRGQFWREDDNYPPPSPNCLERFKRIKDECLCREREDRPSMPEIVRELEIALQYQEAYENGEMIENGESDSDDEGDF